MPEVAGRVPVEKVLSSEARCAFERYLSDQLQWTIAAASPPWIKEDRSDNSAKLFEWLHKFGQMLGRAFGQYSLERARELFLQKILSQPDERCWELLQPIVEIYMCVHVFDGEVMSEDATAMLQLCLDRLLQDRSFNESAYRAGEFYGSDIPQLIQELMFVSIEKAPLAKRFVNGDWSEIDRILPVINQFVRAAGWSSHVMSQFLTLCERARDFYPADVFADQVIDVMGKPGRSLENWRGTFILARIAGLVQYFADRDNPMPVTLGQNLLRILDYLVDMGDRPGLFNALY